jgi:HSP20 family protein
MARERGLARSEPRSIQQPEVWDSFPNMERMMRNFFLSPWPAFRSMNRMFDDITRVQFTPEVDLSETETEYTLSLTVPGMTKDDVNIDVTPDSITVSGERKVEDEKAEKRYHLRGQSYGAFTLSYTLPSEIKPDDVKAVYKNGLLEITLPKAETAKRHKVEVQVEG